MYKFSDFLCSISSKENVGTWKLAISLHSLGKVFPFSASINITFSPTVVWSILSENFAVSRKTIVWDLLVHSLVSDDKFIFPKLVYMCG